jgi:hypothetical protein
MGFEWVKEHCWSDPIKFDSVDTYKRLVEDFTIFNWLFETTDFLALKSAVIFDFHHHTIDENLRKMQTTVCASTLRVIDHEKIGVSAPLVIC